MLKMVTVQLSDRTNVTGPVSEAPSVTVRPCGYTAVEKGHNIEYCQKCWPLGLPGVKDELLDLRLGFRISAVTSEVGDR